MARIAGTVRGARPGLAEAMLRAVAPAPAAVLADGGIAVGPGAAWFDGGRFAVALDGRVYNADELPAADGPAGNDRTAGNDAAVVAAAVATFGVAQALARLNGDFALAVLDRADGTLHLARDPFGIKPLYHTANGGPLAFASRPRALFAVPGVSRAVRRDYVASVAAANYRFFDIEPARSPYVDIAQLPPGHMLTWRDGAVTIAPYAVLAEEPEFDAPVEQLAEEYRALFFDAVGRRLKRAKNPAFTLSGGLDSSSVITAAGRIAGRRQMAVSSVYSDAYYDETAEIRDVIDAGIADWTPVRIDTPDLFGLVSEMVVQHDEPVATVTWMAHQLLTREVKARGHDALFGGLGGDEQHAGEYDYFFYLFADLQAAGKQDLYDHEVACWIRNHDHPVHRKTPEVARAMAARLTDPAQPGQCRPNLLLLERYRGLLAPGFFDMDGIRPVYERRFTSYLKNHTVNELLRNTMPCCLRASERNCDAAGLEDFFPFHDQRLLRFMLRIPTTWKIRDGVTKWFLRQAMKGVLPEPTRTRIVKTGWNAPAHRWVAEDFREPLLDLIRSQRFRERGIYDADAVERLLAEHVDIVADPKGRDNHMMFFWQLLNLELWLRSLEDAPALPS